VPANEAAAARFLAGCLHLAEFPAHAPREADIDLYHSVARVKVREEVSFHIETPQESDPDRGAAGGSCAAELVFDARLDHRNFLELEAGAVFGHTRHPMPLEARDEAGRDVSRVFFDTQGGRLRLARPAMPAMLTLDEQVVRQDCLCYLMERVPAHLSGEPRCPAPPVAATPVAATPVTATIPATATREAALSDRCGAARAA
jgi:hypothetical protein